MTTLAVPWEGRQTVQWLSPWDLASYPGLNSGSIMDVALGQIILLLWSFCGFSISKMGIITSHVVAIKFFFNDMHNVPSTVPKTESQHIFLELLLWSSSISCRGDKLQYFELALRSRELFWWLPFATVKFIWRKRSCSKSFLKRPELFRLSQFLSYVLCLVQTKLQPIKYLVFNIADKFILGPVCDIAVWYCIIIYV